MPSLRSAVRCCSTLLVLVSPQLAAAQDEAVFVLYHGRAGQSRVTVTDRNEGSLNFRQRFSRSLTVGTPVCVVVQNAHPANYKYSLEAIVDTSQPELPDLTRFNDFIGSLSGYLKLTTPEAQRSMLNFWNAPDPSRGINSLVPSIPQEVADYIAALALLKADVDSATTWAKLSDAPEGPDPGTPAGRTGYQFAVGAIAALPSAAHRFNDAKLKDHLGELFKRAKQAAKQPATGTSEWEITVEALGGFADLLVNNRDQLKSAYSPETNAAPRLCKSVAAGTNTFRLAIAKVKESGSRDVTGKGAAEPQYLSIEVLGRFQRKVVSVDPLSLGVLAWNVPRFSVEGDTLRQQLENPVTARPGLMLSLNPSSWGVADDWGLGLGLGLGLGTESVVTDVFMGAMVSFRNTIRVGIGYGRSRQPASVRNASVGMPVPANLGRLDDAVQPGGLGKDAVYFLLALPGLSLKSK